MQNLTELIPCRKCGSADIWIWDGAGSWAEIFCRECGQKEGLKVCDLLISEEVTSECRWPPHVVKMAKEELQKEWNRRFVMSNEGNNHRDDNESELMNAIWRKIHAYAKIGLTTQEEKESVDDIERAIERLKLYWRDSGS